MKARMHMSVNILVIFIILSFFALIGFGQYIIAHILFIIYGGLLFILGAILPDSDSNDRGSYIYHHKWLKFIAYPISLLEYPLMMITHRKKAHRESLHTILGIFVTSFVTTLIFFIIGKWIFQEWFIFPHLFGFVCLFFGQLAHLIEDIQKDWKPSFK